MEREQIVRVAREKLGGATSRMVTGEYGMLARLLQAGEEIVAMVLANSGAWWQLGSGKLIVATDRRLLLVSKGMISRREAVQEFPREHLRGARLESPMRFVLELDEGERTFRCGLPAGQIMELVAYAERRACRFAELEELAGRKLGGGAAAVENELMVLETKLDEHEAVLDLAWSAKSPTILVAVCPERLFLVPAQGLRSLRAPEIVPYGAVLDVAGDDHELVIRTAAVEHRLDLIVPDGAAPVVAARVEARVASRGSAPRP